MSTETPLVEGLRQKWQPVIEHADLPDIQDSYRKNVTAILLENQEKALREEANVSGVDTNLSLYSLLDINGWKSIWY